MPKVYVIGKVPEYENMFTNNGWTISSYEDAEFVQFTGGEDVSPILYGEHNVYSGCNANRDTREVSIFRDALKKGKNLLSICRGSQFLTVMAGHSLWQDVNNHAIFKGHEATMYDGTIVQVSSTHHQMMRLDGVAPYELLMWAGRTTEKRGAHGVFKQDDKDDKRDVESVFHHEINALCFQPHPEFFDKTHQCQKAYFSLIEAMF